jgi:sugar phosphate isomerase/epimerase
MILQRNLKNPDSKMQLGISSYTYTWAVGIPGSMPPKPLSAYDLVDKAFKFGLGVVQIADNLPLESWSTQQLSALSVYAHDRQVRIEMGGKGMTHEHTMRCLETAKILDSSILRMVIDGPGYEPDLKSVIGTIQQLLPEFESRKIKLAIENHDRFKAREFEKIILSTGNKWAGICLDSVNSMGAGEGFETVSEILMPYTINLHLKDFSIKRVAHKMGLIIEGRPAGSGMLKISDLVSRLSATNRCQSAILELWTPPETSVEATLSKEDSWANESIEFLKTIL